METWTTQRKAASRERRAFAIWWFALSFFYGIGLLWVLMIMHSGTLALFIGVILVGAWMAPLLALYSLRAPPHPTASWPAPDAGYRDWLRQAHQMGRTLLYHMEAEQFSDHTRAILKAAHDDLRDTLRAHPLRDDLERVCTRIRDGALREAKEAIWLCMLPQLHDLKRNYTVQIADVSPDRRIDLFRDYLGAAAILSSQWVLPRLLARERWECVEECTSYALQLNAPYANASLAAMDIAAALIVEWADFSQALEPVRAAAFALAHVEETVAFAPAPTEAPATAVPPATTIPDHADAPAPAEAVPPPLPAPDIPPRKHYRRVRVKTRHEHSHHHHHHHRTPADILWHEPLVSTRRAFRSFAQWLRYAFRSWMLYR